MEFNSLPLEIQLEIFSYLSVSNVMKIRLVCEQWNDLINSEVKFKRLRCRQSKNARNLGYDLYFQDPISFLMKTSDDPKFSRVKYLKTSLVLAYTKLEDAFDLLNSFKLLERTEFTVHINSFCLDPSKAFQKLTVNLDHLKVASFEFDRYESKIAIVLNLPKLIVLRVGQLKSVKIGYPDKLKILSVASLFGWELDCSQFTSLTKIYTRWSDVRLISASFIARLPSLRELNLGYICSFAALFQKEPHLEANAKLKIFHLGFEITINQIESGDLLEFNALAEDPSEVATRFIIRNRHQSMDNNPFLNFIHYNLVASELNDSELFGVMWQKFPRIYSLDITGHVTDPSRLLKFIGQFRVSRLSFERTSLSRSFFEKLAKNQPNISSLKIGLEPTMDILSGDYDFIFRLNKLYSLQFTNGPLPLNFAARLLKEQSSIWLVRFGRPEVYRFGIEVWSSNWVTLQVHGTTLFRRQFSTDKALEVLNVLESHLKADRFKIAKELPALLRHLEIEKENHLFMMKKYIYDQAHSICLSEEQMRLLNFRIR